MSYLHSHFFSKKCYKTNLNYYAYYSASNNRPWDNDENIPSPCLDKKFLITPFFFVSSLRYFVFSKLCGKIRTYLQ